MKFQSIAAVLFGVIVLPFAVWCILTGYTLFACHHQSWNFDTSGGIPFVEWVSDAGGWAMFLILAMSTLFPAGVLVAMAISAGFFVIVRPFSSATRFFKVLGLTLSISVLTLPLTYWIARLADVHERCSISF